MSLKIGLKISLAVTAAALLLGGCGGIDGVQLNGKVFDAMGFNDSTPQGDPKMGVRQPLTLPPTTEALPPPGSGKSDQPSLADIQDPDKKKNVDQAELQRQQDEYCRKNYQEPLERGDSSGESASGPLGSCHPSIFTAVQKWTAKKPYEDDGGEDGSQTQ